MSTATRMEGDGPMSTRYRFDPMALIAGLVFLGIAIAYVLHAAGVMTVAPEWTLAIAAIGVGVAGLAGAVWTMLPGSSTRRRSVGSGEPAHPPVDLTK
ncbi:hypothetical protein [Streptomyces sp. SID3343]|uniref:hypothetical protein n=1 Tax=Streptomyces sp. SID3343 TaxID=2690260 RepID=UPI00136F42C3|nr:hypothetical protein [Streptomyces sp. SID3343]MYV97186.1 hypothetical protein [Streptomyces sp. SID3343]